MAFLLFQYLNLCAEYRDFGQLFLFSGRTNESRANAIHMSMRKFYTVT